MNCVICGIYVLWEDITMAEKDLAAKTLFSDNQKFAELFNLLVFRGEAVVDPDSLQDLDKEVIRLKKGKSSERIRDLSKSGSICLKSDGKTVFAVLCLENQSREKTDLIFTMMERDLGTYRDQFRKNRMPGKKTKLIPVISAVILWSGTKWYGPMSLKERMDIARGSVLDRLVNDYRMPVLLAQSTNDKIILEMKTELRELFWHVKYLNDQEMLDKIRHSEDYRPVEPETVRIINILTGSEIPEEVNEDGGKVNMCKAIDEMVNTGRIEGKIEGRMEGIQEGRNLMLAELYAEKVISLEKACTAAMMTKEEFLKYCKKN